MGHAAVGAALDRLGDMRFRSKVAALRRRQRFLEPDQLLWLGLLEALGYGGNQEAFLLLATRLPWAEIGPRLTARPPRQRLAEARKILIEASDRPEGGSDTGSLWTARGQRPGNGPRQRLEGAAHLAARFADGGPATRLLALIADTTDASPKPLIAGLSVPRLIGPGRADEIAANVVLPFAAASGDEGLSRRAEALYRRLPLPARYGAVRHLHRAVGRDVPVNARRQQGMLYLLRRYCTQGGCAVPAGTRGSCPLASAPVQA
jgi:hypothetical protein